MMSPEKQALCSIISRTLSLEDGMSKSVLAFMVAFDQLPRNRQERISAADFELASKLIQEEIREMFDGFNKLEVSQSMENLVEFVDGAVDTIYVILWTLLKFNVPVDALFAEVQRSNMAKLNADGTYTKNEHGKVKKPDTWTAPDLLGILVSHFDEAVWQGNMRRG
jgi:hypothetical protein